MNNYPEFVKALAKKMETPEWDFKHACLGIIGEIGELADAIKRWKIYENPLNKENVLEELGDLRFYMQMLMNSHGFKICDAEKRASSIEELIFELALHAGSIAFGNKIAFYNLYETFVNLCARMDYTEENVIAHNVAKLIKRYPNGKYSNEDANERKDKLS